LKRFLIENFYFISPPHGGGNYPYHPLQRLKTGEALIFHQLHEILFSLLKNVPQNARSQYQTSGSLFSLDPQADFIYARPCKRQCHITLYYNKLYVFRDLNRTAMMIVHKTKLALFRMSSYGIVILNILTFGIFIYLIAPYTTYFFFNDVKCWKYLSYFHKFYFNSLAYIRAMLRKEGFFVISHLPLSSPPMESPDLKYIRISKKWSYPGNSCGTCSNCCYLANCCFLDTVQNKCVSYGSIFWRYFNCGRFPTSKKQLEYYKCVKYEALE